MLTPLLCAVGIAVFLPLFMRLKRKANVPMAAVLTAKCGGTAMAALLALQGAIKLGSAGAWLMFAAVTVCVIADGVLHVRFIPGGILFALGHVLYMVSFCLRGLPGWQSAVLFALLAAAAMAFIRAQSTKPQPFIVPYALVLCLMTAMAFSRGPVCFAGALLFAFSDSMLLWHMEGHHGEASDWIAMGSYYAGQYLLALSLLG